MRARYRRIPQDVIQEPQQLQGGWLTTLWSTSLRPLIFWSHLGLGVVTGLGILVMSVTGVLLAFERQIVAWAERDVRQVMPPLHGVSRLPLDVLVAKAQAILPDSQPSSMTLRAESAASLLVSFGRDQTVFLNPYSGVVLGAGATALRSFFHAVTDWHRWLAMAGEARDLGRAMTGVCNAAFVVLVLSGVSLWWPRRWTVRALQAVVVPRLYLRGKARDWHWHHVAGFWSCLILLCITLTGLVMSYQWANDLLYTLTGSVPPPRPPGDRPGGALDKRRPVAAPRASGEQRAAIPAEQRKPLETFFAAAAQQAPHWRSMTLRFPQGNATRLTVTLEEARSLHPYPRSTVTLDAMTAAVVQWEPYASYNLGRTLRSWVRPVHTGEAGGLVGQVIAAVAAACGVILVWTGLALAWRRFYGRFPRASRRPSPDRSPQA